MSTGMFTLLNKIDMELNLKSDTWFEDNFTEKLKEQMKNLMELNHTLGDSFLASLIPVEELKYIIRAADTSKPIVLDLRVDRMVISIELNLE